MMDWPEVRIFHAIGMPVGVEAGGHPGARHRAVEAVARVLLARPDELHRLADLFRDQDRLPHEILEDAAPAEAAAQHHLVDHDLVGRHAGCVRRDGKRGFAVLRGRPDLDPVGRHMRRAVLRLHGGMTEEGHLVVRFDAFDRLTRGRGRRRRRCDRRARPRRSGPHAIPRELCRWKRGHSRQNPRSPAASPPPFSRATSCPPRPPPRPAVSPRGGCLSCRQAWSRRQIATCP